MMPFKYCKLFFLLLVLFISCEELEINLDNPFEADIGEQIPEIIYLDQTVDGSTASFHWEGNKFAFAYSYSLESLSYEDPVGIYINWSDWSSDTLVTLEDLDEGQYIFQVKSRFDEIEQAEPSTVSFEIDAVTGPALRIYPIKQEVEENGSQFDIYLIAEEFPKLMLMTADLQFDTGALEVVGIDPGDTFSDNSDFIVMQSADENREGSLSVTAGLLSQQNLDEAVGVSTAVLAKVTLKSNQSGQHTISILSSSVFRNNNYEDIGINAAVEGSVEVK